MEDIVRCIFFLTDTATTEIYTLSLHDALPILQYIRVLKTHFLPKKLSAATMVQKTEISGIS